MIEETQKQLLELYKRAELPQGILLSGSIQEELLVLARELSKSILETEFLESHPDFIYIESHKVEDLKKLLSILSLKSFNKRVVVLDRAEDLTHQAISNLLKKIEEPSDQNYYLVITTHKEKILPTLRSRLTNFVVQSQTSLLNSYAETFLKSRGLEERLSVVSTIDAKVEDLSHFLKTLFEFEVKSLDHNSVRRLPLILKIFELLSGNVQPNRALNYLAVKW